jgi:hypothetical protein
MKAGVVIFSRPGADDVELVRVENGTHVYHLTPIEAVNMAADLMRYAAEILRHKVFMECSIDRYGRDGVHTDQ